MQIWPEAPKKKRHKRKLTRWFHIPYLWFTNEEILRINQNVVCHQQQHYPNCHRWAVSGRNMRPKTSLCHDIRRENICPDISYTAAFESERTNNTVKRIWDLKPVMQQYKKRLKSKIFARKGGYITYGCFYCFWQAFYQEREN